MSLSPSVLKPCEGTNCTITDEWMIAPHSNIVVMLHHKYYKPSLNTLLLVHSY